MTLTQKLIALTLFALTSICGALVYEVALLKQEITVLQGPSDGFVLGANDHGHWIASKARTPVGDKTEVDCAPKNKTAVLLIFGQSNSSNESKGRHTSGENVVNFSYIDGKCYRAADPLVGASGIFGSFGSRLGDLLVAHGKFERVVLVPMGIGGSYMQDWAPGGQYHRRLLIAVAKLRKRGMEVSHFLFHQGEVDGAAKTDPKLYRRRFLNMVNSLRKVGAEGPVYIAVATVCGGPPHPEISAVQWSLPDADKGIFPGPDTDLLGVEYRYDRCHFSEVGVERHAEMWFQSITDQ